MTFRRRLATGFALTLALTAALAGASIRALLGAQESHKRILRDYASYVRAVLGLRLMDEERESAVRGYLLVGDPLLLGRARDNDRRFVAETIRLEREVDPPEDALLEAARSADAAYDAAVRPLLEARRRGEKASELVRRYQSRVQPWREKLVRTLDALIKLQVEEFELGRARWTNQAERSALVVVSLSASALALGAGIAWLVTLALSKAHEQAQAAARAQGRLAATQAAYAELESLGYAMSHNLRAPARAIEAFGRKALSDPGLAAESRRACEAVVSAGLAMGEIIDGLLRLMDVGRVVPARARVDVTALAREAAAARLEGRRGPPVDVAVQPGLFASADANLLRAALEALIDNAVKFSARAAAPRVEVGAADRGGELVFFVRDNGVGFDPAFADKLFKPFQHLHPRAEFAGAGIGLAVVLRAVRAHGGRAWAESTPGRGATFYFTLPEAAA